MPNVFPSQWHAVASVFVLIACNDMCLGQEVEIQINALNSDPEADIATDDYITWAPTFCRARLVGSTSDMTVVLTNDNPAYYLFVGGNNLQRGTLEIGDQFQCDVDGMTLKVSAASTSPAAIAAQVAAAWNASTVAEFMRFNTVVDGTAVVITAKDANDASQVSVSTFEADNSESDGQTFLKTTKGDVRFAAFVDPWPINTTASQTSLTLTNLASDGSWRSFVIAGRFRHPSTMDKDAVIVAHKDTAAGDVLGEKKLMVRVRKNANGMGKPERDRFLAAMRAFRNRPANGYLMFQELHRLASEAGDEAHRQPAFFSWHRALLLHVERELQEIDASVTLPYWNWDEAAPNVFSEEFMGAPGNLPDPADSDIAEPIFAPGHPFIGWDTDLPFSNGGLRRNLDNHASAPASEVFRPLDHPVDPDLLDFSNFSQSNLEIVSVFDINSFSVAGEYLAHDSGHNWPCRGGHLRFPMRSATDPLFFLLHSQVDRQWAYWQWKLNRFGVPSGNVLTFPSPTHYDNQGTFDALGNTPDPDTRQKGAYLEDGLWPWDGTSGGSSATPEERPPNQAPTNDEGLAQSASNLDLDGDGNPDVGTITLRNTAHSVDDFFNGNLVRITGGTGAGQFGVIFDYIGSARLAGVSVLNQSNPSDRTWVTVPDATSKYIIVDSNNVPHSRPVVSMLPFPSSKIRYLWPGTIPVVPKNRHMIDYLGRFRVTDGLGFCYEDVPY